MQGEISRIWEATNGKRGRGRPMRKPGGRYNAFARAVDPLARDLFVIVMRGGQRGLRWRSCFTLSPLFRFRSGAEG
jgi:hypothetical protein